jgi:putative amidoligase enzyme
MTHDINLLRYSSNDVKHLTQSSLTRLLSAEIELCGFKRLNKDSFNNLHSVLTAWNCTVVRDGSLSAGGVEINTHPASGDFWLDQIHNIMSVAQAAGTWVDCTAGCHIHVNCLDFDYLALARLLRILACVEAGLYSIIPSGRADNRYCKFWAMHYLSAIRRAEDNLTGDMKQYSLIYRRHILNSFYGFTSKTEISRAKRNKGNDARYRGINLHSYLHRGTMEFRMPPGTIYSDNIINWGLILGAITEYAKNSDMDNVKQVCKEVEQAIFANNIYNSTYFDLTASFLKQSFTLLLSFAPTIIVADWLTERRKWAKNINHNSECLEQS